MAAPVLGTSIPVWLSEEDLSCIICQGLLDCPVTLPCGHSFCHRCLNGLWVTQRAGVDGRPWACPTCREGPEAKPKLRKNLLLQDLADKYRQAALELEAGPATASAPRSPSRPAPPPVAVQKNTTEEVIQELTELMQQLVDIVKSLQTSRPGSGLDNELGILGMASSSEKKQSLSSPKLVMSSASERKIREILQNLEEIQKKIKGSVTWKEDPGEQVQEMPSSSLCQLPDQRCPVPRKSSQFALWAISPTFDLGSISCNLVVSNNCRRVTVSHCQQPYRWSPERFLISQVLCSQALSSGQKYWEVDTRNCNHWAVGVASWGMKRNQMLGRTKDSWCIEWKGPGQFSAWATEKKTDLHLGRPEVVGVWLDLELGELAFYSCSEQERLLYECEVSVSFPLHPAFWLYGLSPGNYLEIKQVNS
ncbi:E3 ubiquitin-protein ligase RNF135 isoform X1 [Cricetulus griseus]|uniref:E3 ubiquitin-protein ligase RNF135 n=1 Tax=Cricetulus griseus TaxID=10029 RepID=A0A9J7GD29_CRIGR|nr:E3 ubiquitin-protein ligase RNF135 isoform X2 [Cricetulus griseus]XP_035312600.1 E3 ubiquitin-protein ligase RNF135 isoform X1 [Cricetulus griseus]